MSDQEEGRQPPVDEEQLREALRQLKVDDVLLQTVVTLVSLGGRRLTVPEEKDREQAHKAIEAVRVLLPLCPEEEVAPIKDALSRLQMLYVKETDERAKARSKIWTPGQSEPVIGVFGGSGFYRFLDAVEEEAVDTPYGPPSARIRIGEIEGQRLAFMPRHGDEHSLPPHRINYRANVWAMREVGVRRIVGPSACGSLKPELSPGTFVICDQFVDRTVGREDTFYDGPQTTHVSAAEPYCRDLGEILLEAAGAEGVEAMAGGTVVVIQGPRFSTRAESRWFSSNGWDVVNMTQYPECWLARELGLCYANVSLVTDYDVGLEAMPEVEAVTTDAAVAVFRQNLDRLRALLFRAVPKIGPQPDDACASALDNAIVHH